MLKACCQERTKRGVAAVDDEDDHDDDDVCFLKVLCRQNPEGEKKNEAVRFDLVRRVSEGEGKWFRNIDYYRLDGSTNATTRKKWAEEFNDTSNTR